MAADARERLAAPGDPHLIEQGTVAVLNARSGRFALALADGSYVLAEVLGAGQLSLGECLVGEVRQVGPAALARTNGGGAVEAFVLAYEVSRQAAEFEIAWGRFALAGTTSGAGRPA